MAPFPPGGDVDNWHATYLGRRRIPRNLTAFELEAFFSFNSSSTPLRVWQAPYRAGRAVVATSIRLMLSAPSLRPVLFVIASAVAHPFRLRPTLRYRIA